MYKVVEKGNPLVVHGIFDSKERAEHWLKEVCPRYVERSYFMDKTLTQDSFMIVERNNT